MTASLVFVELLADPEAVFEAEPEVEPEAAAAGRVFVTTADVGESETVGVPSCTVR